METTLDEEQGEQQQGQESLADRIKRRKAAIAGQQPAEPAQPTSTLSQRIAARKAAIAQPVAPPAEKVAATPAPVAPEPVKVAPPVRVSDEVRRAGSDALAYNPDEPVPLSRDPNWKGPVSAPATPEQLIAAARHEATFGKKPIQVAEDDGPGPRGIVTTGQLEPVGVPRSEVERVTNDPQLKTRIASRLALEKSPSGLTIAAKAPSFNEVAGHTLLNYIASPFIGGIADEDTEDKLRRYAEGGGKLTDHQVNLLAGLGAAGAVAGNVALGKGLGAGTGMAVTGTEAAAARLGMSKANETMRAGAQKAIADIASENKVEPSRIAKILSTAGEAVKARAPQLKDAALSGAAQGAGGAALTGASSLAQGERDPEAIMKAMGEAAVEFGIMGAGFHALSSEAQFRAGYNAMRKVIDNASITNTVKGPDGVTQETTTPVGEDLKEQIRTERMRRAPQGQTSEPRKESPISRRLREMAEQDGKEGQEVPAPGSKPPGQTNFEENATASMLDQMQKRAAAGEPVPGFGQTPREGFTERARQELENTPKEPQPSFSAYHQLIDYADGKAENPPTHWQMLPVMTDAIAAEYGFTPDMMKSSNDALARLRAERPPAPKGVAPKAAQGTRVISPNEKMELYRTIAPDAEVKVGDPIPAEGKKFPVTTEALKDYAGQKGLSILDAAAKMREAGYEVPPVPDLPDHEVKTVINANGFRDFVQQLQDEKGMDEATAQRTVVQKYRDLVNSGMSAKDANGEMGGEIKSLLEEGKEPAQKETTSEVAPTEEVTPSPANETQKPPRKRIGRQAAEKPKSTLPDGYSIQKRGDVYVVEGPEGHLRARSWTTEDAAIAQAPEALKHAKPYDWGHTPFAELRRRSAGMTKEQMEARQEELITQMKSIEAKHGQSKEWSLADEELTFLDSEITHIEKGDADRAAGERRNTEDEENYRKLIAEHDERHVPKPSHMHETADDVLRHDSIQSLNRWIRANPDQKIMKDGIPDDELLKALDFGTGGNTSNIGWVERTPKSWKLSANMGDEASAEFKGKKLTDKVRELLGIPRPGEVAPEPEAEPKRDLRKKTEEPAEKTKTRDRVVQNLGTKAAAARERIRQRAAKQDEADFEGQPTDKMLSPSGKASTPALSPEDLSDYAIIGAEHMARGSVELGEWSTAMVKDLGESVKPHLRKIFGAAIQTFNDEMEAAEKEEQAPEKPSNEVEKTEDTPTPVDNSKPADTLQGEEEPNARNVRANVEGGPEAQRPEDVRGAGGERAPGSGSGRGSGKGRRDLRGTAVEPREAEPGSKPVPTESGAHSGSAINGEGSGVGGHSADERKRSSGADTGVRRRAEPDAGVKGTDYSITDADAIGEGGERTKARDNVAAIETALRIRAENRPATREEQAVLAKYVGWGGLKPVFEPKSDKFYQEIHDRLKELLSPEEFNAARATILNAHYTSPTVVKAMWNAVEKLGFKGGKVLEPGAGVGNFIGLAPQHLKGATHFTAVERDRITATIAGLLYPEQNVVQSPFENYPVPDGSIDLAIGNPPFGDIAVFDKNLPKELRQQIHDYFFVRAVNALRPGGVLAFVTSDGTMDKASSKVRSFLAERTKLITALRLPNNTFVKNARTQVTTDVIILQKLATPGEGGGPAWEAVKAYETPKGDFRINEYFADHPEHMLGHLETGGQYSKAGDQKLVANEGDNLEELLKSRLEKLPENIIPERDPDTRSDSAKRGSEPLPEGGMAVRDGGMMVVNGEIMRRQGGEMVSAGVPKSRVETVKALIGVRDAINGVRRINAAGGTDAELAKAQKALRKAYDAFVDKYGPINKEERIESEPNEEGETVVRITYPNLRSFEYDPESPFVRALENYDYEEHREQGDKYRPKTADIMHRRTIAPREKIETADSPTDALISSLNEHGGVNLDYMADLLRKPVDEVRDSLKGRIFQNPQNGKWETADQYLSGNVKKKLAIAQAEIRKVERNGPQYLALNDNIEALKNVQPADLPPSKIAAVLGAPWIPEETIGDFAVDVLGLKRAPEVTYNAHDGSWRVEAPKSTRGGAKNTLDFGTKRIDGATLLGYALNMKHPVIVDRFSDGTSSKNVEQTMLADEKMEAIKDAFSEWLWKDDARAKLHAHIYNALNNTTVIPSPDGSYLEMPGVATHVEGRPFAFQPHQRNYIARFLQWGRAAAFHVVGAGKTFAAIGAIMEAKRLGLVRKPIVTIPNHMLGQWTREFLQLYPGANLLVATEYDFDKARRREFLARMASSNYDAIIMTHSAFEKVPMSLKAQQQYIQDELDDLATVLKAARDESDGKDDDSRIVKDLVKSEEKLRTRLEELRAEHKKDDLLDFEELGVDHVTVDEAHMFKNLNFNTALENVRGRPSQRATDLEMKSRYLHKVNPKHSLMFLTGTPISNSFSEAYVMQRYMQPEVLKERGLFPFDAWAKTFARERMAFEMKPSGDGFRQKSRFDRFVNLGEFAQMFRSFADIQMAHPEPLKPGEKAENFPTEPNLIRLERPPLIGGKPEVVLVPKTAKMKAFMNSLMARAQDIKGRRPEKGMDNMLSITNDGRLAALDLRTVDPHAEDSADNKLSIAADRISQVYHETADIKGTQIVFSDILRSSAKGVPGFDVYKDLIGKLVDRGVKKSEIAIVHDYDSQAAKLELFMQVRSGAKRILIGSTDKMGAGTNVQTRLVAEHQLDVRWRPVDVEQREGRILRQGNKLYAPPPPETPKIKGVRIFRYATEGSIDAFQWGMVTRKAGMISQGMTADVNTREIEDVDEQAMTFAEIAAAASGDPRIIRRAELDAEVGKLERLRRGHADEQWTIKRDAERLPGLVKEAKGTLEALETDAQTVYNALRDLEPQPAEPVAEGEEAKPPAKQFRIEISGKEYSDRGEANKVLAEIVKNVSRGADWQLIGKYAGMPLQVKDHLGSRLIGIEGKVLWDALASVDRPVASVEALPGQIPKRIAEEKELIERLEQRAEETKQRVGAEFPQQEKLDKAKAELQRLNFELSDKKEDDAAKKPKRDEVDEDFYGDDNEPYSPMLSPAKRVSAELGGPKRGPSMEALSSPAAEPTPLGKRIRQIIGMSDEQQSSTLDRVKSLRTITGNLSKMAGVPIRQGRFLSRQRQARGVFFVKPEVARVVRLDMLDTAAHEVGHYVSKHYLGSPTRRIGAASNASPNVAGLPTLTAEMKRELTKLGKTLYGDRRPKGGYGEEGIAEWTSFYVTNPGKMASESPEFTNFMELNVLPNEPGLKAALDQARADFATYRKAPAMSRVDAMINVKPSTRWRPTVKGMIRAWFDDLADIREAVDELGGADSPAKDAYILARLSRGSSGVAEDMVENGIIDPRSGERVTRGLSAILADVGRKNIQDFRRYLISERALELWERGIDPGISAADAKAGAELYRDQFGDLAEEMWGYSAALIRYRATKGLLTADEADAILDNNQRRVPFYRVFDEAESKASRGIGRGYARNSSGINRIKGSVREIIDPLESMITDTYNTVKQSHAAEVMMVLVKQSQNVEGGGRVVEVLTETPKRLLQVNVEDVKWQLQELGIQVPNILKEQPGILTSFENLTQARGADRKDLVMPLVIDGKRKWVQMKDADLYDAVAGLGTPQIPEWARVISIPTRTLRAGATLTPEFMFRNPFRDAWAAARFSKAGVTAPGYHFVRGIFHLFAKDGLYEEWKLSGGDNAAALGIDRPDVVRHLYSLMHTRSKPLFDTEIAKLAYDDTYNAALREGLSDGAASRKAALAAAVESRGWVLRPIDTLRLLSSIAENATRLTEYERVKAKSLRDGATSRDARLEGGFAARDLTLDFNKAGTISRNLNQIISFFNANMLDWDKEAREFKENPAKYLAIAAAMLTIPSLMLWATQKDDEEYKNIPAWQKAMAWVVILRDENGVVTHRWRIPKPPGIPGLLFSTGPVAIAEYITGKDPKAFEHMMPAVSALNPAHWADGIQPIIEWWANKNSFTGRKIVPEGLEKLPGAEQATSRTGELARQIGRWTNLSPAKIENTVKGYTGGLGQYGMDIGNIITRYARQIAGAEPFPRPPETSDEKTTNLPVVRGFTYRKPQLDAQPVQDALDAFARADGYRTEWRRRVENGASDADSYFKEHEANIRAAAGSTDGLGAPGPLRTAHDAILDAQRASRDADPAHRDELSAAAVKAAEDALKGITPGRDVRRTLRKSAMDANKEGQQRLKRIGKPHM